MDSLPKTDATNRDTPSVIAGDSVASELHNSELHNVEEMKTAQSQSATYQSPGLQAGNENDGRRAVELKFLVDLDLAQTIRERAMRELQLDPFSDAASGTYGVSSYYLDTAERDIYHRTELLNGTKYRFRQYKNCPELYLERKVRRQGIVTKQRYIADLNELRQRSILNIPVWSEISEFCLAPSCAVHYTRSAFIEKNSSSPFRVTIDTNLTRYQFQTLSCLTPKWSQLTEYIDDFTNESSTRDSSIFLRNPLLPNNAVIEFKFMDSMPKHLIGWLEDYKIAPIKFSKYRASVGDYLEHGVV